MARYSRYALLYEAFEQFIEQCLIRDGSLLWPDKNLWTAENASDLIRRIAESPITDAALSFEDKLEMELRDANPDLWGVLADLYYVYFLPSDFITLNKKQKDIQWAVQNAGYQPLDSESPLWDAQTHGFTRTGYRYHTKFGQFAFLLQLAVRVKALPDRRSVFKNHLVMQELLDDILNEAQYNIGKAYDMRHAILYLTFPEQYERMISTQDKKKVIETYGERISGNLPDDTDEALRQIREAISQEYSVEGDQPFDYYDHLRDEWRAPRTVSPPEGPPQEGEQHPTKIQGADSGQLADLLIILNRTRNLILYGPPGTGKTFFAEKVARALIEPQLKSTLSSAAIAQRVIEDLPFYDILALSMYPSGASGRFSAPDLQQQPLVKARYLDNPKNLNSYIWNYLQAHTVLDSKTVNMARRSEPFLFDKDPDSRWRLTDEGRKYVEESLGDKLNLMQTGDETETVPEDYVRFVTFHQSYAYEDFVEGLRPKTSVDEPGQIAYEIAPGIFRRICNLAAKDSDNLYVLIIDEINRGNIAKILGELITLLEDDKREKLSVYLPYSQDKFTVPANLYLIGTMNTADRSIALLDVALRRRFAFAEIKPDPELLKGETVEAEGEVVHLDWLLRKLNRDIAEKVSNDHQIGHSYLMAVSKAKPDEQIDVLSFVWNNQILPLLEEYFYSDREALADVLQSFHTDIEAEIDPYNIGRADGENLVSALAALTKGEQ